MNVTQSQSTVPDNEGEIRALIERWAKAVREENRAAIRADHDPDILMFDVPPPFLSRGLDAYMATWELFFSCVEKPVVFSFHDIQVTCGEDVGFATAIGQCVTPNGNGKFEPLAFRLTMGLRRWMESGASSTNIIRCLQRKRLEGGFFMRWWREAKVLPSFPEPNLPPGIGCMSDP